MTKAAFETLNPYHSNSFLVRKFSQTKFTSPYHFHPEYELALILKGEGSRYVGSHIAQYSTGDLVLLGTNLPHCWKTKPIVEKEINASSIIIQFNEAFLGIDFFTKPELSQVLQLLKRSTQGIQFLNKTVKDVTSKMILLSEEEIPFKKLLLILEILYVLALSKEFILLDQQGITVGQSAVKRDRINKVLGYIVNNFKNEISLDEAAAFAHMTPNAFCKYYKKTAGQTFMETVIDYRINYAVQQLIYSDKPVSDICFDSGFGDVSHFYKLFKKKIKLSPLNYRKKFMKDI